MFADADEDADSRPEAMLHVASGLPEVAEKGGGVRCSGNPRVGRV